MGRIRRRWLWLVGAEGALFSLAVLAGFLALGCLGDWIWEWSRAMRMSWLAWVAAATGTVLVRQWVGRCRAVPGMEALGLMVEARRPELRSRLISALQLSKRRWDEPEAAAFVARLNQEAVAWTGAMDLSVILPADRLRRWTGFVAILLLGITLGFAAGWPTSGILLRRAMLDEVGIPRRTRLVETSGAITVGRGDDVTLWARASGVLPKAGQLWVRHESGKEQRLPLDSVAGEEGRYARTMANVMSSFSYRVRVNDSESVPQRVEVLPRPVVTELKLTQVLPRYTGLPARVVVPGELSLLRGSRLQVEGRSSTALQAATFRLSGVGTTLVATVTGNAPEGFQGEIPVQDSRWDAFAIQLEDVRGIGSKDPAVYAVEVVPDLIPQVRMLLPTRREELVTARGTVLMSFEAKDDYGIAGVRIRHQPAGATNGAPGSIELDWTSETGLVSRRRFEWRLSTLVPPLAEGALYEFWVEAADRNDVDGPGIGRSERFLLRVVSEAEKRADLLGRAGDAIGRLGDVAEGQERLNESLGRIILAKPAAP